MDNQGMPQKTSALTQWIWLCVSALVLAAGLINVKLYRV